MSVTDGIWGLGKYEALLSTPSMRLAYNHNHLIFNQSFQMGQMDAIKHKETN